MCLYICMCAMQRENSEQQHFLIEYLYWKPVHLATNAQQTTK